MKQLFSEGNLTAIGGTLMAVAGASLVIGTVAFAPTKFLFITGVLVGVLLIAVASASLKSLVFGIKPFTNDPLGWRKAKESYKSRTDTVEDASKSETP